MKKILALGWVMLAACIVGAEADIIPSFNDASAFGSNTVWSYNIDITSQQSVTTGDFFTIYDFGNFVSGSNSQPFGWSLSSSFVGNTPSQINPTDDPSLLNLTWTYDGPAILGPSLGIGLFRVTVLGPLTPFRTSQFAAQGTRADGPNAGSKVNNIGEIPVPTAIPEPSVLMLIAAGGVWMVGRAISRRPKS
jgi:hypothetical protein